MYVCTLFELDMYMTQIGKNMTKFAC